MHRLPDMADRLAVVAETVVAVAVVAETVRITDSKSSAYHTSKAGYGVSRVRPFFVAATVRLTKIFSLAEIF